MRLATCDLRRQRKTMSPDIVLIRSVARLVGSASLGVTLLCSDPESVEILASMDMPGASPTTTSPDIDTTLRLGPLNRPMWVSPLADLATVRPPASPTDRSPEAVLIDRSPETSSTRMSPEAEIPSRSPATSPMKRHRLRS